MKVENSIEEDIKILEEFIKYYEAEATSRKFRGTLSIRVDEDDIDALENLINMYKRVLKENEELKILKSGIQTLQNVGIEDGKYIVMSKTDFLNGSCKHLLDDYIPKQEIKDKIEELNRKIDKSIDNSKGGLDEEFIEKAGELLAQKRILQELLGSEE